MGDELERLKSALLEERRILAAICFNSQDHTVRIPSNDLAAVDENTAISKLQNPDGSLTISVHLKGEVNDFKSPA